MGIKGSPALVRTAGLIVASALALGAAGCAEDQSKGYVFSESALQQVSVGSSQEQVLVVLGTPSTTATLKGQVFYYISQKTHRPVAFMNPKITDQRVLAIFFDQNRRVEKIADYGMKDGRVFDFRNQVTPTAGQEQNFIEHMFKGLLSNEE
ncbi:outer membrane protein assembly factor BamE [Hansschlegelia beijingensis]|uniref:outer membrane protein assembly factor BamE n=1 Tax=Hansschlegelia beijingensis TaxID=1133344 RepID=UPI0038250B1D